jgi:hypothetical protein
LVQPAECRAANEPLILGWIRKDVSIAWIERRDDPVYDEANRRENA